MIILITNLIVIYVVLYIVRVILCSAAVILIPSDELKQDFNIHNMIDVFYFVCVPMYMFYFAYKVVERKVNKLN